ncbi:MAG: hypothetical protein IT373_21870 [Polyangiaceae bacterium]|nr:hypothetical protein [Polyangiaceae bacterium]
MRRKATAVLLSLHAVGCDPVGLGLSNPDFRVIGHRGAPNLACENTMASFAAAAAVGANAIETDICVTAEGVQVVWHDADPDSTIAVARQAGAEGLLCRPYVPDVGSSWRRPVDELLLAELQEQYGYAWNGSRDPTAAIPLLSDFTAWLRETASVRTVYLDLKLLPTQLDSAFSILHALGDDGLADPSLAHVRFYLLTVHEDMARALEAERLLRGYDSPRVVLDYEQAGALGGTLDAALRDVSMGLTPSQDWHSYKREVAETVDAREAGAIDSVTVWTFDREMQLAELLYYSVDGVMTNEPALLYRMWQDSLE